MIITSASYNIRRAADNFNAIPYGTGSSYSTYLSYDKDGNYFDFDMSMLDTGYMYELKLSYYNGSQLIIELINGHEFHLKTLEKDLYIIEAAINDVLKRSIKVKFRIKEQQSALDLHGNYDIKLKFASEEESHIYYYLCKQVLSSVERIKILNNLITTYLILVDEDFKSTF